MPPTAMGNNGWVRGGWHYFGMIWEFCVFKRNLAVEVEVTVKVEK